MSDLFRNHIVGFPTKWLIYSLHHKQLKISCCFFTDIYCAGGGGDLISLAYCQFLFWICCNNIGFVVIESLIVLSDNWPSGLDRGMVEQGFLYIHRGIYTQCCERGTY